MQRGQGTGAMDSFGDSLNRLRDVHEKEVLGLQNKLRELNTERCREAQRVEELFAKNHQLREQQKVLKENLRVLENRLRAGLCDRCVVTQELARKKQLDLESAHLQSLQHLCILTNEMNRLKEENKALKEEVKRLQGLEDRPIPQAREGSLDSPPPLPLSSPGGWKVITEKPPRGPEEAEGDHSGTDAQGEEKPPAYRTSPVAKISPGANLPELRALDMSPQRISNQLHSTVAVVRPGSRCPANCGSTNGTPPLPPRSSPPSPASEHGLPLDSFLRTSRPSTMAYESLKQPLPADRLCLLNRHLSLHLRSPHGSPLAPTTAPHSPRPQGLKAGELEAWKDPTGLPSTLGVQSTWLEGALHLLLAQQQLRARAWLGMAGPRAPPAPGETVPSPPSGSDSGSPESEVSGTSLSTAVPLSGHHPQSTGPGGSWRKEAIATQNYTPDIPLDLSDRGQNTPKSTGQPGPLSPTIAHTPSPEPPALARPQTHRPESLGNGTKGTRVPEPEEPPSPKDTSASPPRLRSSLPSPGRMGVEGGERPRPEPHPQRLEADGHPEPSTARAQRPESDKPEELDTSENEVGPMSEEGAKSSVPGEEEHRQSAWQKRKRSSDLGGKASKKPSRGRRKLKEPLTAAAEPRSPGNTEDLSPSPSHSSSET